MNAERTQRLPEAIVEFLDSADYKLITYAITTGATVTREQPEFRPHLPSASRRGAVEFPRP